MPKISPGGLPLTPTLLHVLHVSSGRRLLCSECSINVPLSGNTGRAQCTRHVGGGSQGWQSSTRPNTWAAPQPLPGSLKPPGPSLLPSPSSLMPPSPPAAQPRLLSPASSWSPSLLPEGAPWKVKAPGTPSSMNAEGSPSGERTR